ncbi:VOC family protein [Streptomyces chumphonensis]|uniref:VOC family protein n=1 Tax=Streptomyces chumphonensis TaxID=1214925 RepID=A0A927IB96_9ACTN|nr:VOC family protein [Streptomyces chumphonensis]MBD3932683.1 VOC family protein [Streptomyces chumphonensis]
MAVAKTCVLVLDSTDPEVLAEFYAKLLGGEARLGRHPDFIEIVGPDGTALTIQRDHGFAPPTWPRPEESQQSHLHLLVAQEDMDEAEREIISLGGRPLDTKDNGGAHDTRLYSDPGGHPFALVAREGRTAL